MAYTSFTQDDFYSTPYLGELPLSADDGVQSYDLSKYVPNGAKEVLIYLYVTVRETGADQAQRSVYEIYTEDDTGRRYSQLMNVVFTATKDFVMNSANLWFPIVGKRELKVRLPAEWSIGKKPKRGKSYANTAEAIKDFVKGEETVYTGVNILGYR